MRAVLLIQSPEVALLQRTAVAKDGQPGGGRRNPHTGSEFRRLVPKVEGAPSKSQHPQSLP